MVLFISVCLWWFDAGVGGTGHQHELAATLRGSRPGVQSASLIMMSFMTS